MREAEATTKATIEDADKVVRIGAFALTDLGNAERLVERHGDDLHFCHPWGKWLVWDERRWPVDATAEVVRRATETVRSIYLEASEHHESAGRKAISKWAERSEDGKRIREMIQLATSRPGVPVLPEHLGLSALGQG